MKKEPIRILHVLQRMEAGGTQALLMNIYRNIDRSKVQFDFLVEYKDKEFYDDEILSLGGKIYYTNFRKDKNIIKFKKYLKKILKANDYKIIHVHTYSIGYFVLKIAKKCGIQVRIAHSHSNNMTNDIKKYIKKIMQKLYLIHATDFMACSNDAGEYLFGNKEFLILNNAIDTQKFIFNQTTREKVRKTLNIENNFVVGHVGRFKPEKNHHFLIEVFNDIKHKKQNAKLLLIGNGDPDILVRKKIKEYDLENDVIILQNRNDVNELYQAMDVFVFPSIYEGLGIVAIESQAAGTPTITSSTVPQAILLTPLIKQLSLDESCDMWANEIISISDNPIKHTDTSEYIIKGNFDIMAVSKNIENYYINKYQNLE